MPDIQNGYEERIQVMSELGDLRVELARARTKFPRGNDLGLALVEEVEELFRELDRTNGKPDELVRAEALQVACVALRLAQEGDATWRCDRATSNVIEDAKTIGLMARHVLHQKYPSGGDERPAEQTS